MAIIEVQILHLLANINQTLRNKKNYNRMFAIEFYCQLKTKLIFFSRSEYVADTKILYIYAIELIACHSMPQTFK